MNKKLIIPGILTDSMEDWAGKVKQAQEFAKRICIDVIDGLYADNLTVMPENMREISYGELDVDVQLMTVEPVDYLGQLHMLKVDRVFGQVERMGSVGEFGEAAQALGLVWGLAYGLHTPIEAVPGEELVRVKEILLMAVPAGFSGQKFDKRVLEKIEILRGKGFEGNVVVDGGMDERTIPLCLNAGANQFSVTSALWEADDVKARYKELEALL